MNYPDWGGQRLDVSGYFNDLSLMVSWVGLAIHHDPCGVRFLIHVLFSNSKLLGRTDGNLCVL